MCRRESRELMQFQDRLMVEVRKKKKSAAMSAAQIFRSL